MKDLLVGDYVLTASGTYKHVYRISRYHRTKMTDFIQIHTSTTTAKTTTTSNNPQINDNNNALEITPAHLLFIVNQPDPVPAHDVQIGTYLQSLDGPRLVTNITMVKRKGLYNPITTDGTIVVDGILASAYSTYSGTSHIHVKVPIATTATDNNNNKSSVLTLTTKTYFPLSFHTIAHMAYAPYCVYRMIPGLSSSLSLYHSSSSNDDEFDELATAKKIMKSIYILTWEKARSIHLQLFVFMTYMCFFGCIHCMIKYNLVIAIITLSIIIRTIKKNGKQGKKVKGNKIAILQADN